MQKILSMLLIACWCLGAKTMAQTTGQPAADSLAAYRVQIDSIDQQIINWLGKRMRVVEEVGAYKARHNMPALQQKRFDAILQKNIGLGKLVNLSETFITELMHAIHRESLAKEEAVKQE